MTTTTNGQSFAGETVDYDKQSKPFVNKFINDGSFMETFKKMMQQNQQLSVQLIKKEPVDQQESSSNQITSNIKHANDLLPADNNLAKKESSDEKAINSSKDNAIKSSSSPSTTKVILGKRPNQKLKVGIIKRNRTEIDPNEDDQDAWTKYMKEVRQYKEKYGDDSDKKRPLVK